MNCRFTAGRCRASEIQNIYAAGQRREMSYVGAANDYQPAHQPDGLCRPISEFQCVGQRDAAFKLSMEL